MDQLAGLAQASYHTLFKYTVYRSFTIVFSLCAHFPFFCRHQILRFVPQKMKISKLGRVDNRGRNMASSWIKNINDTNFPKMHDFLQDLGIIMHEV